MGNWPTIADLSAYYEVQFLMLIGEKYEKWPNMRRWMERMGKIDEVVLANKVFLKILNKRNK